MVYNMLIKCSLRLVKAEVKDDGDRRVTAKATKEKGKGEGKRKGCKGQGTGKYQAGPAATRRACAPPSPRSRGKGRGKGPKPNSVKPCRYYPMGQCTKGRNCTLLHPDKPKGKGRGRARSNTPGRGRIAAAEAYAEWTAEDWYHYDLETDTWFEWCEGDGDNESQYNNEWALPDTTSYENCDGDEDDLDDGYGDSWCEGHDSYNSLGAMWNDAYADHCYGSDAGANDEFEYICDCNGFHVSDVRYQAPRASTTEVQAPQTAVPAQTGSSPEAKPGAKPKKTSVLTADGSEG